MIKITTAALFLLAIGIFTSPTILSGYQILFAIPVIYYSFLAIREKKIDLPKSAYWLLAFTVVTAIGLILNLDTMPKPAGNFGKLKYFLFGVGGIFVFRVWLREASEKTKKVLANAFLLSVVVAATFAGYKFFFTDANRARGFTDIMRYGYGSAMMLVVLLSSLIHREKMGSWFNARFGVVAFIFGFVGMYITYTRGALLGFICGLPVVLYYYRAKLGIIFAVFSLVGLLGIGTVYLTGIGNFESRFLMNKNNESDTIRRSQWKAAVIATQEKPVFGWGLSNFHTQLKRIKYENDLDAKYFNNSHAHNLFLEIAAGTGLVGFLCFMGWLVCWAWEMFRAGGLLRSLIIPFGVVFVVSSQFEVTFDTNNSAMIYFLYAFNSVAASYLRSDFSQTGKKEA